MGRQKEKGPITAQSVKKRIKNFFHIEEGFFVSTLEIAILAALGGF